MNRTLVLGGTLLFALATGCAKQSANENKPAPSATQEVTKPKAATYKAFGDSVQSTSTPLALADAIKVPSKTNVVRVSAKISEVCQNKGCWMILTDGNASMRVTFKDYGFFVPKDISGKTIIAEGLVTEEIIPEEDARHYAEDAGKSKAEVKKIKGNQKQITMVAQSVFLPVN
jgi:hypothetical protein